MSLRRLSLESDLEEEIWKLYRELMDEHGMDFETARHMVMIADQRAREYIKAETA